jgi:D-alanyl-D-alanine carboxypeptidase
MSRSVIGGRGPSRARFVAVSLLLAATAFAQADKIDDFVNAEMRTQNIPGLSLVVVKDGRIVKAGGYGLADTKRKIPATAETVYKIASVSKQFIAAGIMVLVQSGQLGLDDPISKHLEGTPPAWKPITIRHALTHTSGLIREAPGFDGSRIQSDADVIKTAYPLPVRFTPGNKWEYSNTGYFALAEIIRIVSGRPWPEFLSEKVFGPSGMTTTHPTNTKTLMPNRATGYSDNDKLLPAADWAAVRPSGAFLSTVLDLAKWDAVLYGDKVLSESTRREMWTPVTLTGGGSHPYGFGWQIGSFKGRKYVFHSGGMPGFRAQFARFLDDRLTIVFLANLDDSNPDSIVQGVAAFYLSSDAAGRNLQH